MGHFALLAWAEDSTLNCAEPLLLLNFSAMRPKGMGCSLHVVASSRKEAPALGRGMEMWFMGAAVTVSVTVLLAFISFVYKHGYWKGEVNSDRKSFKDFMKEIKRDIREIKDKLSGIPPATSPGSPLELTDYGKKLSKFLDAEKWAEEIAETLLPNVAGKDGYEVQEYCNTYVFDEFEPTDLQAQKIRECMFQNGATRTHVNEVFSLVLRDKLLDELGLIHLAP